MGTGERLTRSTNLRRGQRIQVVEGEGALSAPKCRCLIPKEEHAAPIAARHV
jgi:hypothetical protein